MAATEAAIEEELWQRPADGVEGTLADSARDVIVTT